MPRYIAKFRWCVLFSHSMLAYDPEGKVGPSKPLPDMVAILESKPEQEITAPVSDSRVQDFPAPTQSAPAQSTEVPAGGEAQF